MIKINQTFHIMFPKQFVLWENTNAAQYSKLLWLSLENISISTNISKTKRKRVNN